MTDNAQRPTREQCIAEAAVALNRLRAEMAAKAVTERVDRSTHDTSVCMAEVE